MGKYRKKPVVIDAIQWTGKNIEEIVKFIKTDDPDFMRQLGAADDVLLISTLEGEMIANIGDWIIKGVAGEYYPCKPDIFEQTYSKEK